jgi:predicted DNA-binding transcriptional regulator YafY
MHTASRPFLARIVTIDGAIRDGGWPNARTLGSLLEVSPRTVQRDIGFLRDRLHAPVHFDPARNGYCYTEPDYALPYHRLTEGDLLALFLGERLLLQYRGTPLEDQLQRAFAKIAEALPEQVSLNLATAAKALSVTPAAVPLQDAETFQQLASAAVKRRRLELDYWTMSRGQLTSRKVDPYHLTRIESDWYMVGYCHLRQQVLTFATVRVRSVRETGETFERPADFRVEEYLAGCFRACRGEGQHRVVLRFTAAAAGRVAEKQWHISQTTERRADGSLELQLEVSDLREVLRWVLSWGAECEVVGPEELRRGVREEMAKALQFYSATR